ncbi:ankyrin repeat domain-containing protein [Noviherbaspirillum galbum]|uniref:Ankyrin repeat domain-containing protein n=1 Tax=Noviherbaspirillum galbum TaxID=2709383 RepID=A0A6B3SGF1_9BURK|nr:ankyrin repeat domain-containing protein [Noviherbaspirillum galbum]NEX59700.1 ankyrin repeat domain-containing protein [Noviherbaspirillum galbum]
MTPSSSVARTLVLALALAASAPVALAGAYDDFFRAAKLNDAKEVQTLIARGFDPNTQDEARGETGLMVALREGSMETFQVLLNAPDINLETRARNGDTALMIASFLGNLPAVKALLDKGAQVNRPGWTALHYAAAIGNNDIVSLLLEQHAYIDAESPNKTTPIMMAARAGKIYTVKLLLDEGADATLKNDLGMTAIDFAEKNNFKDIAEGLTARLRKAGKL